MKDSTKRVMLDGAVGGLFGASAIVALPPIVGVAAGTLLGFHAAFASANLPLRFAAFAGIGAVGGVLLNAGKWDTEVVAQSHLGPVSPPRWVNKCLRFTFRRECMSLTAGGCARHS